MNKKGAWRGGGGSQDPLGTLMWGQIPRLAPDPPELRGIPGLSPLEHSLPKSCEGPNLTELSHQVRVFSPHHKTIPPDICGTVLQLQGHLHPLP